MNCAKSFAEIKHESFEFMELGENPSSGGICFNSTAWHAEWRDFSTVLRILHCKVLCERGAIAKGLDAIRCASVSLS
jgi:hypothetical protein